MWMWNRRVSELVQYLSSNAIHSVIAYRSSMLGREEWNEFVSMLIRRAPWTTHMGRHGGSRVGARSGSRGQTLRKRSLPCPARGRRSRRQLSPWGNRCRPTTGSLLSTFQTPWPTSLVPCLPPWEPSVLQTPAHPAPGEQGLGVQNGLGDTIRPQFNGQQLAASKWKGSFR